MLNFSDLNVTLLNEQFLGDQWPVFKQLDCTDSKIVMKLYVPENLEFFAGHFPQQAVLPGVVQIHWVGELASFLYGLDAFYALKNIKFNSMVLPNNDIVLAMEYKRDKQTLRFDFYSETEKFSNGVLAFLPEQEQ